MVKSYYVVATDAKYYASDGEAKDVVGSTTNKNLALKEAEHIV